MQNATPKTAQAAIAQANRFQRAQAILTQGYTFSQDVELNTVLVTKPGRLAAEYTIGEQLTGRDGCSCPDFQRTGIPCKHMMAWEIVQKQEEEEAQMWEAQCARYDEEEGWLDAPYETTRKTTTAQFLEALQARMVADLNKAETAIRKQKFYEVTGHDCNRLNLTVALRVIGEYWGKELVGRFDLLPADKVTL